MRTPTSHSARRVVQVREVPLLKLALQGGGADVDSMAHATKAADDPWHAKTSGSLAVPKLDTLAGSRGQQPLTAAFDCLDACFKVDAADANGTSTGGTGKAHLGSWFFLSFGLARNFLWIDFFARKSLCTDRIFLWMKKKE